MVKFGMWSTLLLVGSLHGLVVAGLLVVAPRNRVSNRFLAALLCGVVLMITPYTIGYAGIYDAYPWLTFAPLQWQLAFGPLFYLYVRQIDGGPLPSRCAWHLAPAAVQGIYYVVLFALPLQAKWRWDESWHGPLVMPALNVAILVSICTYWWLSWRRFRDYQRWLEANSARREELRLGWLRGFLCAVAFVVALNTAFQVVDYWGGALDYYDYFPFYLVLSLLVYYLGIEGWRHASIRFPPRHADASLTNEMAQPPPHGVQRDWRECGERWAAQVAAAGWWREPDLALADLARRLGTNTQYLSRALNDGLGMNFSMFVNGLRVDEAKRLLDGGGEVLSIALEVGFGSKSSFNRAFHAHAGMTPSAWRARTRVSDPENR